MTATTTCAPVMERAGAVTFKGNPLTLRGPALTVGAKAPDFQTTGQDLAPVTLGRFTGTTLLISSVPSLDTPVCDAQTRRFNEAAATLPGVQILAVSMDLPFAQKRWCGAAGISQVTVVSDYKDASFGKAYGLLIKELRLLTRAIVVVDAAGTVRYVEVVPEVTAYPNYDAALAAVRQVGGVPNSNA